MRRSLAAALVLLTLAACSVDPPAPPGPAGAAAAPSSPAAADPNSPWRPIPAASRAAYLKELDRIDPGLTRSGSGTNRDERAVRRGENTCLDIKQQKDEATLVKNTAYRFNGETLVDEAMARRILPLIRKYLCPKL